MDLARQALQVSENDPGILANAAFVLAQFEGSSTKRVRSSHGCTPSALWSSPAICPFRNPEDRELLLSGLRLAAGEAT
jgi:hypothetical protein